MASLNGPNKVYDTLHQLILGRHSVRRFLTQPISEDILKKCVSTAQLAPSNNNLQPWRTIVVTGDALVSLKQQLQKAWSVGWPDIPETPKEYLHHKEKFGAELYGKLLQIGREDHDKRNAALSENFDLYGASAAAIVYMDKRLSKFDILSAGFWMQNFTLALRAHDIEACYMASVAGYPELLMKDLDIPNGSEILCGIALGYKDSDYIGNKLEMERDPVEMNVSFKSDLQFADNI